MLMKTSHDFSMRFDIELFPRGSCYAPTTAHRDIAANFKVDTGGAWETAAVACAATVKLQSGYDVGYGVIFDRSTVSARCPLFIR